MSWFIPYTRLDTGEQIPFLQQVKDNPAKNFWLKGYAGTGKSVLLIHCLLQEKERKRDSKIIIVLYTYALIDMIKTGIPAEYADTRVVTYFQFRRIHETFDLVLVDEIQDLPESDIREIQSKGKRVIVAGDVNQSIFDDGCETNQIETVLTSQSFSLNIIHRISRRIRQVASLFCADRTGFNAATMGRLVELPPRLIKANAYEEECNWLWMAAKEYAQAGYAPAILIPRHVYIFNFLQEVLRIEGKPLLEEELADNNRENYRTINSHLRSNNLKLQYLGSGAGAFQDGVDKSLVTVMTYHSAKGLDFKAVFVPFLVPHLEIWRDPVSRARTLFFVAITRSREQLFMSYNHNEKHPYLAEIPINEFHHLTASNEITRMNTPLEGIGDKDEPKVVF